MVTTARITTTVSREPRETCGASRLGAAPPCPPAFSGIGPLPAADEFDSPAFMVASPCASSALLQLVPCGPRGSCVGLILVVRLRSGNGGIVTGHLGKEDGNERQRTEGRQQQPSDDGAAQRRILLSAIAQAQRHGRSEEHTSELQSL